MMFPKRPKCQECEVLLFDDEIMENDGLCHRCQDFREAMQVEHVLNSSDAAGDEGK
jgi:acetyl-CoA carboxylase beta subunit